MPHLHWLDLSYNLINELEVDSFFNSRKLQVSGGGEVKSRTQTNMHTKIYIDRYIDCLLDFGAIHSNAEE